jgi:hypothetical protein
MGVDLPRARPDNNAPAQYLMMIPILCGLALYANLPTGLAILRFLLTGLFFGLAAIIKPNAVVGILPVVIVEWQSATGETDPALRRAIPTSRWNGLAARCMPYWPCERKLPPP